MVQIRIGKIYIVYAFIALYWHVKVFNMPYFNSYLDKGVQGPPSHKKYGFMHILNQNFILTLFVYSKLILCLARLF